MSKQTKDVKPMTHKEHRDRHKILHRGLDELFADYIDHHRDEREYLKMPLIKLINWSHQQTFNPTEKPQ